MNIVTMNKNTPKGRKKIQIKKIEETTSRQVTFSKRRSGLFKKAAELCVLTEAEMAILVQSPGGHCYVFGHPSADALIDRYMNYINNDDDSNGSTSNNVVVSVSTPKRPSVTEVNRQYDELEKELEKEKRKYEAIQQEKMGNSSEFPWYEQDIQGMEVEELEQYVAALGELKRKVIVRAGDLANMESASMLSLGPSSWSTSNLPNTYDQNAPLSLMIENNTMNVPKSDVDFGDGIKFVSNTTNGLTNGLDFGDGNNHENNTKSDPNYTMNGLSNGLDFNHENNTMNVPISDLNYTMNGLSNGLNFRDNHENNTMICPTASDPYFGEGIKIIDNNTMNRLTNAVDFGDGNNINTMNNGPTNDHMNFGGLGLDLDNMF